MVTAELERRYGADYDIAAGRTRRPRSRTCGDCGRPTARSRWCSPASTPTTTPSTSSAACAVSIPSCRARRHRPLGRLRDERGRARRAGPRRARPLDAAPRVPGRRGVPPLGHRAARDRGRGTAAGVRGGADRRRAVVATRRRAARSHEPQQRAVRLLRQRRRGRPGGAAGARPHGGDGRAARHGRAVPTRAGTPPEPDGRGAERRLRRELDGADRPPGRRRHHRRRAGRPGRGRLRRVRGAGHARRRAPGLRRAGGHDVADPQLPGLPLRRERQPPRQHDVPAGLGPRRPLLLHAQRDRPTGGRRRPGGGALGRRHRADGRGRPGHGRLVPPVGGAWRGRPRRERHLLQPGRGRGRRRWRAGRWSSWAAATRPARPPSTCRGTRPACRCWSGVRRWPPACPST